MFIIKLIGVIAVLIIIMMMVKALQNISSGVLHCKSHPCGVVTTKRARMDHMVEADSFDSHVTGLVGRLEQKEQEEPAKPRFKLPLDSLWNLNHRDVDVQNQYKDLIKGLKIDLMQNERKCRHIQQQLEWMSNKATELEDEVLEGQRIYTTTVGDLARNLQNVHQCSKKRYDTPKGVKVGLVNRNCPLLGRFKAA